MPDGPRTWREPAGERPCRCGRDGTANVNDILDSGGFRVVAYFTVALVAVGWWLAERRIGRRTRTEWWPTYWGVSALLLVTMGAARATELGELLAAFGRERALSDGWYETRRNIQAIAVASVTALWFVTVVVAIWRIPPRRRRYLPHVVALTTVVGFAAVRIISLHQIDAVLYNRGVGGVRFVAIIELGLLALTVLAAAARARLRPPATPAPVASHREPTSPDAADELASAGRPQGSADPR